MMGQRIRPVVPPLARQRQGTEGVHGETSRAGGAGRQCTAVARGFREAVRRRQPGRLEDVNCGARSGKSVITRNWVTSRSYPELCRPNTNGSVGELSARRAFPPIARLSPGAEHAAHEAIHLRQMRSDVLYFENSRCVNCGEAVAFHPDAARLVLLLRRVAAVHERPQVEKPATGSPI